MKKILVINGPNLNLLGMREKNLYGETTYKELIKLIKAEGKKRNLYVRCVQSNCEGKIVSFIQKAREGFDGLIINAGAYTHYSIAIMDAVQDSCLPCVEVHITDINNREDFRKNSYLSLVCQKTIVGKGIKGYLEALDFFI